MTRSIMGFGDVEQHWKRLGVAPAKVFDAQTEWQGRITVWEVGDADWNQLLADDARPDSDELWNDVAWRYSEGGMAGSDGRYIVNGQEIFGPLGSTYDTNGDEADPPEYRDLLAFMCDELGWSTETNIAGCSADLAHVNGMTLGELWTKYQPAVQA